jgi:hypothetical protein
MLSSPNDLINILMENNEETVLIIPCDGNAADDYDIMFCLRGLYEFKCGEFVTFNYTTNRERCIGEKCIKAPSWPSLPQLYTRYTKEENRYPYC